MGETGLVHTCVVAAAVQDDVMIVALSDDTEVDSLIVGHKIHSEFIMTNKRFLCLSCSVSDRPSAALGAFQTLS